MPLNLYASSNIFQCVTGISYTPPPAWNSEDSISFPFIEYFFGVFEGGCVVAFEVLPVNHNVARSLSATHTKARKGEMTLGGHFFTVC